MKLVNGFLITTAIIISGCQSAPEKKAVSLEEAQKITRKFAKTSFTPPPRSIQDLTFHFNDPATAPTQHLAQHCNNQEADGGWVARFKNYLTHYGPNDRINNETHPTKGWTFKEGWELHRGVSISEIRRGNLAAAETAQMDYLKAIPNNRKGAYVPAHAHLAIIRLGRGNLEGARDALSEAESWESRLGNRRPANKILIHNYWLYYARGDFAVATGDMKQAEEHYRTALRNIKEYKSFAPGNALMRGKIAEAMAAQGRLLEAENEIRLGIQHSIDHNRVGRLSTSPVITRFAKLLIDQGRLKEAEDLARRSVWTYQDECSPAESVEFADARRILAEALMLQERYADTLKIHEAIEDALGAESRTYRARFGNDMTYAYALINQNKTAKAQQHLQRAVSDLSSNYGADHPKTSEARGFLAIAEWKQGNTAQAEQNFKAAINRLQDPKQRVAIRAHNYRLIVESYIDMMSAKKQLASQDINQMFVLSEYLRNSSVAKSIAAIGARAKVSPHQLAQLVRQEQDTRSKLAALESTLTNALAEGSDTSQITSDLSQLKASHSRILDEISGKFPKYGEILSPKPATLTEIQNTLLPDEAFIATYSSQTKTHVWTVRPNAPFKYTTSNINRKQMQSMVDRIRESFMIMGPELSSIPTFNIALASQIYNEILKPSRDLWQPAKLLLVAPHGPLGHLPLSTLPTKVVKLKRDQRILFSRYQDVPFLVKTHAVSNIPSGSAFKELRSIKQSSKQRQPIIAFGDPWFNAQQAQQAAKEQQLATRGFKFRNAPQVSAETSAHLGMLPRLPETADELAQISKSLGSSQKQHIYLGTQANEQTVKSLDLSQYRIVAFATHGLTPGDLDGLTQPALALTDPKVSKSNGDGLLTMDEIMNLKLDADWVLLSACNTGSSDGAAAEAVSGLGRAFFYSGARSILVSNWPVETISASELTTGIFKHHSTEKDRALSLHASMKKMLEKGYDRNERGQINFAYAHPIFWAPFTLVGNNR